MNGIEKIIDRISGDAQAEIDVILNQAKAEAAEITAKYEAQAKAEADDILSRGTRAAAEREERLVSVAQLECRKAQLAAKQEVIDATFQLALKKLLALPEPTMWRCWPIWPCRPLPTARASSSSPRLTVPALARPL